MVVPIGIALIALGGGAAEASCGSPGSAGYSVDFPQGDAAPIKLYLTDKGGRVGSVKASDIQGKVELCSGTIGPVNQIRLPKNIAIDVESGKAQTASGQYWVRSNQIRFESKTADNTKDFACERNQVKTRVAGGAAGAEGCK
ncbi:MAG: hypothetical protein ACFB13_11210 [Kiloniellaceae bacterium]